ncbi:polysaccharide deacetylase family protein [Candidatus Nitronereus thalassa]|uniref:Polysaccharide deacetylase family protein n=1 Tax=Candidatus Nitronereus thalassa TaxID=3020898 RepID=A0ABU3K560_9BACT|nr:polysaccharide deacetylase family protein [Candidatus Nitronereus thalassa]MDT7041523.1 polysaccharide deacetylase family protein [Candidatus Nitronereus thalassa]
MGNTVISNIRWVGRYIKNHMFQGATILIYHRVAELPSDWQLMSVTPQHFGEHLDVLRKKFYPMSLQQLHRAAQKGKIPKGAVAVTFDDGYADNLYNAKPLLEKYDVPASFYVTCGCLDQEQEFWWDDLDRMLLQPQSLPQTLTLTVEGIEHSWKVDVPSNPSPSTEIVPPKFSKIQEEGKLGRKELYRSLHSLLRPLPEEKRRPLLDEIAKWSGSNRKGRVTHASLTTNELEQLGKGGLVEIGAHTVTHPVLSSLSLSEQRDEILQSKEGLEEKLNRPILSFAYPYGERSDYSVQTPELVKQLGFSYACSNYSGIVRRGVDPFQLPRVSTRDWNGEEFSRRISTWFPV